VVCICLGDDIDDLANRRDVRPPDAAPPAAPAIPRDWPPHYDSGSSDAKPQRRPQLHWRAAL
jgi:hypothetical protein